MYSNVLGPVKSRSIRAQHQPFLFCPKSRDWLIVAQQHNKVVVLRANFATINADRYLTPFVDRRLSLRFINGIDPAPE